MIKRYQALFAGILCMLLSVPFVHAQNQTAVTVFLTARKVVVEAGMEKMMSADTARPGDTIEYQAEYTNTGASAVENLKGTVPIPAGMEYLPGTAKPAKVFASTDGKDFSPAPLQRKTHRPNGKEEMHPVPAGEYRALRWDLGKLASHAKAVVRARVRVTSISSEK